MKRTEYLEFVLKTYRIIHVLSDRNECQTLHLRHRELHRDLVLRSFAKPVAAYELLCGISCGNLPLIYDVIPMEDGQIVLEEFIDGMTLEQAIECRRYTYREAKGILASICCAVAVLHQQALIHRDIKPENVMLTSSGRVVLLDFNASRQVSDKNRDTVIMGTVGYISPEQLGILQSDARTDIYALGVLLNVMLTGRHPSETITRGRAGAIVRRCTNVNPSERYQSVDKLLKVL